MACLLFLPYFTLLLHAVRRSTLVGIDLRTYLEIEACYPYFPRLGRENIVFERTSPWFRSAIPSLIEYMQIQKSIIVSISIRILRFFAVLVCPVLVLSHLIVDLDDMKKSEARRQRSIYR